MERIFNGSELNQKTIFDRWEASSNCTPWTLRISTKAISLREYKCRLRRARRFRRFGQRVDAFGALWKGKLQLETTRRTLQRKA